MKMKWVAIGVAGLLVAAVAWLLSMHLYYQQKFDARVAELKAAGQPVSLDDLEKAYVLPEGAVNAADVYLEAFANYQEPTEEENEWLPISGKYISPDDVPPFPVEVMNALESHLGRNQKTLDLLDKAAGIEHCLWPRKFDDSFFLLERQRNIKYAARLLCERILYLAQTGNNDELVASFQNFAVLSERFLVQPFMADYLVCTAIRAMGAGILEDVLNQVEFSEAQLQDLQNAYIGVQSTEATRNMVINERCTMIEDFGLPIENTWLMIGGKMHWKYKLIDTCYSLSWLKPKDKLLVLDACDRFLQNGLEPSPSRIEIIAQIRQELGHYWWIHLYLNWLDASVRPIEIDMRVTGNLRCAETALAIERYRLKYGAVPKSLEGLVPEFMAEAPRDPFDGAVLRYVRDDDGYTIYTIGEDGVDNGGVSQEEMRKRNGGTNPQEYDWPFTVKRKDKEPQINAY